MKTFNKTLEPDDYGEGKMGLWVYTFDNCVESKVIPFMPGAHIHRRWEYGMALEFLRELGGPEKVPNILDVGGAGSLFAPMAMAAGYAITVVDPDPCVYMLAGQQRAIGGQASVMNVSLEEFGEENQFDVVVSISTIEHVLEDVEFLHRLQRYAKKGLFLTTDFSMSGERYSEGHMRTYTPKTMKNKLLPCLDPDWKLAGAPEWKDTGPWVLGYNFASLAVVHEV